ncbi:DUF1304 domain-containing protein [Haliangium ochraceum]|uniref:DUF1304 domain-containing protein n=1 Tax=Haliangium ochraceum (strain DSM 14365 / JCM 11303 / SMP-2) TaxID=502025 RepID=D0LNW9_HALO1|nr:DUF1304 domain-containing protein [Haliangium ochraceum]ACY18795.1 protein of unknown function DUF1304 [Haliangium ochraceum DSM 14365]
MHILSTILALLVAIQHLLFMVLEMFLWEHPNYGLKIFSMTPEVAASSAGLAFNQGLYNGFLAAGLLWSAFLLAEPRHRFYNKLFFLLCVLVAGIVGGLTAKASILFVQGAPALLALLVTLAARPRANAS